MSNRTKALAVAIIVSATTPNGVEAQLPGTRRIDLQTHGLSVPGRKLIQARVELDPGVASAVHRHPGEEIVYVVEGVLEYWIEGRSAVTLRPGEVLFIPRDTFHTAKNVGDGGAAELATYIVDEGKPLVETNHN